jgi:acyl CoA:acetate/3-ketoacid CoA transferase alpha subunit/acyl CoA:acetate/3-ketoacid CoA transferase beta subunit
MDVTTDLSTAVEEHIQLGDTLHFRGGYQFSYATVHELVRQCWESGVEEDFTLVAIGAGTWAGPLVLADAVDRLEVAFAGLGYPAPGPHGVLRERAAAGDLDIESWTYLTVIERLRAGALDHPFVPTNSLEGSSVGPPGKTATIESPFGDGESLVIPPLSPDVSVVHGVAADREGNVVVSPIQSEGHWGAYAADTVVATVEQVVDGDTIREYGDQTGVPSYAVDAVVETPFGAHPGPVFNPHGVGDVSGYGYDREFYMDFREASGDAEALEAWTEQWVLGTDWAGYLERLGTDRLRGLATQTWPAGSQRTALDSPDVPDTDAEPPAERERMVVWTARELVDRIAAGDHEVVFGGIGVSHLASWLYRELCEREGIEPRPLLVESGTYDFEVPRNDAYIFTPRALPTAKVVDTSMFALGLVMSSARNLSVLTGAQVDRQGNVNSTQLAGDHFVGSGGANDALSNSDEVVLAVEASPHRLVDEVEYVTGPGRNVTTVVTQYGTLRKVDGELEVDAVHVPPGESAEARLAAFEEAVGWDVGRTAAVDERGWREADGELVELLRSVDPRGDFRV